MTYKTILSTLLCVALFSACSKGDGKDINQSVDLDAYQLNVISYFKDVALGFEFGNATPVTRKWGSSMKIFVGGTPSEELSVELNTIIGELNDLATDGFSIEIVADTLESNYYIFFGSGQAYGNIFPNSRDLTGSNWGLFNVFWNGANNINRGYMYVDIFRSGLTIQKHLLREELTQSLGLARDSRAYPESIFQSSWTTTTKYATIDEDLIRLLYHPDMRTGLNNVSVEPLLKEILTSGN